MKIELTKAQLNALDNHITGEYSQFSANDDEITALNECVDMAINLAQDLKFEGQNLDEGEFLSVEKYKFDEVVKMCLNNEITDAKTVALVLRANVIINSKPAY